MSVSGVPLTKTGTKKQIRDLFHHQDIIKSLSSHIEQNSKLPFALTRRHVGTIYAMAKDFRERTTYMDRDYQTWSFQRQINLTPVDDDEESRLRLQHNLVKDMFISRNNSLLPDTVENPESVLECGFGTGDWAYEVAESFPDCEVTAVDISPIMELADMPDNLEQEIFDLNNTFTFGSNHFDFVHSQFVAQGLAQSRWPSYLSDIKKVLKSRGWVQLTEWELTFRSENGRGDRLQNLRAWSEAYLASVSMGTGTGRKSRSVPEGLETMLRVSGFQNVSVDVKEVPTCGWPASADRADIGRQNLQNMESLLGAFALYAVTSRLGMSQSDFEDLVGRAKLELNDTSARPYIRLYTCYGQKA